MRNNIKIDGFVKSRHSGEACAGFDPVTGVQTLCNWLKRLDSPINRNLRPAAVYPALDAGPE